MKKKKVIQLDCQFPQSPVERKKYFLNKLSTPNGKRKYKRYLGAPIRYAGGKSLAVGLIVDFIPDDIDRLVSPFLGGGSVEVACAVELNLPVIAYDIFDILINYWKVQLNNPRLLYKKLQRFNPSKEGFKVIKNRLKKHWVGKKKLSKVDLAAYYYFNHNTSYGPHFLGWPSSIYLQSVRYQRMIERIRDFKADNLQVDCLSFEKVLPKYKYDFLYCDPPYYLDGDSKTFVGLYPHRNFPIHHKDFNHKGLHELLMQHKGGFILSYNDCSTIREWYKNFNIIAPTWQYTFSQGDTRIGENRLRNNNGHYVKKSHELIIYKLLK